MTFDINRIQGLSKQINSANRGLETTSCLQRAIAEASRPSALGGILQGIAKPTVIPSLGSYQNIMGVGLAQHHHSVQKSFGMASALRAVPKFQDITRSMASHRVGAFQTNSFQLGSDKLQIMGGLNLEALDARIKSANKIADLARGLTRPYDLREGGFMSALGGTTLTLNQVKGLTSSSAFSMVQEIQSRKVPPIGVQVARAVSEAARVSSGWKPLLDDLEERASQRPSLRRLVPPSPFPRFFATMHLFRALVVQRSGHGGRHMPVPAQINPLSKGI